MASVINWNNLSTAVTYFAESGYRYIDVPWIVPKEFTRVTCPEERWIINSSLGDLVGSSEQSFLYLDRIGKLGKGKFVACSPCFRNEDVVDELRQRTFMKVELYQNDLGPGDFAALLNEVVCFYNDLYRPYVSQNLKMINLPDGSVDLELGGIEIGSYGLRSYRDTNWIYGTALAEPRFSAALERVRH